MKPSQSFTRRVEALIKRARGVKPLARRLGVSDTAIHSWLDGTKPFDSTFQTVCDKSGISIEWLRDGTGDEEAELAKVDLAALTPHRIFTPAHAGTPRGYLRRMIELAGLNPAKLARQIKYDAGVIENVVNGGGRISRAMAEKIHEVIPEADVETMLGGSESPRVLDETGMSGTVGERPTIVSFDETKVRMIPMISWAQAGTSVNFDDDAYAGDTVPAFNVSDPRAIALKLRGDSMEPRMKEGDTIIICPSWEAKNGDIVVVRTTKGDVMCKLYQSKFNGQFAVLSSYNSAHPPLELSMDEIAWIYPVHSVTQTVRRD